MNTSKSIAQAARIADTATAAAMRKYNLDRSGHEDDITGVLIGRLDAALEGTIGRLTWSTSILKHRSGQSAQEKEFGADILIHVSMNSPDLNYSKGVLIQSKKIEPNKLVRKDDFEDMKKQCNKMLNVSPASFVFDYAKSGIRCASATRIANSENRDLYSQCDWTMYRFFLELFRCPIGDPKIISADISELPIPTIIGVSAVDLSEQITTLAGL